MKDAKEGTLNIQFWTFESWIDDRLTWDPVDFGGLRVITVPKDLVWSPNIQMYNRLIVILSILYNIF